MKRAKRQEFLGVFWCYVQHESRMWFLAHPRLQNITGSIFVFGSNFVGITRKWVTWLPEIVWGNEISSDNRKGWPGLAPVASPTLPSRMQRKSMNKYRRTAPLPLPIFGGVHVMGGGHLECKTWFFFGSLKGTKVNSVQTGCIVKGEAEKSPLFW